MDTGKSKSLVEYGSGSTTGTKVSTSTAFKLGVDVSATAGVDILGIVTLDSTMDFTASVSSTDTSSLSINKGDGYKIDVYGPGADGIDHGYDTFWLWLNPVMIATVDSQGLVTWEWGVPDGQAMLIQYVYVRWLQNPSTMPAGVAQALADAGVTNGDFAQILSINPFSSGNAAIDTDRFKLTKQSFPYEPPLTPNDPPASTTYAQNSSVQQEDDNQVQIQVGASITEDAAFKLFLDGKMKVTGSLQLTLTSTSTQTTGSSQSATVTVGGPGFGWSGCSDILVYLDTLYNTFMFACATEDPAASGALTDSSGNPIPNQPLTLTTSGGTFSTFTDSHGGYRFYGAPQGQGTISVENHEFPITVGPGEQSTVLRLPA